MIYDNPPPGDGLRPAPLGEGVLPDTRLSLDTDLGLLWVVADAGRRSDRCRSAGDVYLPPPLPDMRKLDADLDRSRDVELKEGKVNRSVSLRKTYI